MGSQHLTERSAGEYQSEVLPVVTVGTDAARLVTGSNQRVAVMVSWAPTTQMLAAHSILIGVMRAGVLRPLTVLTLGHPSCQLRLDTYGSLTREDIYAQATVADQSVTIAYTDHIQRSE